VNEPLIWTLGGPKFVLDFLPGSEFSISLRTCVPRSVPGPNLVNLHGAEWPMIGFHEDRRLHPTQYPRKGSFIFSRQFSIYPAGLLPLMQCLRFS